MDWKYQEKVLAVAYKACGILGSKKTSSGRSLSAQKMLEGIGGVGALDPRTVERHNGWTEDQKVMDM